MNRAEAIARVEAEYEKTREKNALALDERIQKARHACPEIGKLLDGMARRFEESTRLVLSDRANAGNIAAKLKEESLRDRAQVRRLLALNGYPETFLDEIYNCAQCKDTGFIDKAHIKRCSCFEKRMFELMFGDGSSRNYFERFDPDIYPSQIQRTQGLKARDLCEEYADKHPENLKPNLVLLGKSGLGKTFFLDSIYHRVISRGFPALRVTAFRMLEVMRSYHFGDNGDDSRLNDLILSPFLLIDDIGTEPMLKNITNEYLFLLVNERLYARRPTVYATNLTPRDLEEHYSERISSRLLGKADTTAILLQGDDLRLKGKI
ncbi:MAG: ATP-binding protein [Clostridia bacterium]|nr:ATP-binding protein [Clostridia bacterium]